MKTSEFAFKGVKLSGFTGIILVVLLFCVAMFAMATHNELGVFIGILILIPCIVMTRGFMVIQPNNTRVLTFFGRYVGTVFENGFYWVNPFFSKTIVTLRARNLDVAPIKVNDKVGNPVMIGAVMVWRVKDTYKALFDISKDLQEFVKIQSDAALRQVAGMYAYDSNESSDKITLRFRQRRSCPTLGR